MALTVYVDLSAKLEQWTLGSAVAMANDLGHQRVYFVPSKVKQKARTLIKELHGSKSLNYRLFATLVYLVIRESLAEIDFIVIDRDYGGATVEATIKNLLLAHIRRDKPDATSGMIRLAQVKGSIADKLAKQVYDRKAKADHVVTIEEVSILLGK